jgi:hypothetical protein
MTVETPKTDVLGTVAIVISILAALFTGLQWWEARSARIQARGDAEVARQDAKEALRISREDAAKSAERASQDASEAMKLQLEQGRMAARHAQRSALAAEKTAGTQFESLHLGERAWVGIEGEWNRVAQPFSVRFTVRNAGRTPAFKVTAFADCGYERLGESFDYNKLRPRRWEGATTIMGASSAPWVCHIEPPNPLFEPFTVHILGYVTYEDIFQKPHQTDFCFHGIRDRLSMAPCLHGGNRAD